MKFNKVFCLFEQSGTFKNVFKEMGFNAYDYDIQKTENVDEERNLFEDIEKFPICPEQTIFSKITSKDLVFAFFPCTYFSDSSQLSSRGDNYGQKNWDLKHKMLYSYHQMEIRASFYKHLCLLVEIALEKGFKLVIENPYGKENFLRQFFPIKPSVIIRDRTKYSDYFKKPTQFFFINCEPSFQLERQIIIPKEKRKIIQTENGFTRSKITPDFAKIFITDFILE